MQVKLLRAIQEKAIRPVGANSEIPINVRILSATHKKLSRLVKENLFRQDLFYRINVIELHVPSLRERPEDIPVLVEHFVRQISHKWQTPIPTVSSDAMQALQSYLFPGNVRELENILERAMTLCEGDIIRAADLHLPDASQEIKMPALNTHEAASDDELSLDPVLMDKEKQVITQALEKTRYNKTAAAKLLGLTFRQLRYRIKKLGIE